MIQILYFLSETTVALFQCSLQKMQIVILDLLMILIRNQSTVNYVLFLDKRFLAQNFRENRFDSDFHPVLYFIETISHFTMH